jgi:hypothetical protein
MKTSYPFLLAIGLLVATTACNRDDEPVISEEEEKETTVLQDISTDQALARTLFNDMGNQVDGSTYNAEAGDSVWNSCAELTIDTLGDPFPLEVTLDFGTEGCTGRDGKVRKGKLIYNLSAPYRETGSITTTTPDEYYVNDWNLLGTRTAENLGANSAGELQYAIEIKNGTAIAPNGDAIKWQSTRTRTWVEGQETGFFTIENGSFLGWDGITDDVYELTGTGIGVTREGYTFDVEIDTPLRIQLDCAYITEGVVIIRPENYGERTLDYGDGTCDDIAILQTPLGIREIKLGADQ